jgi:hypothetical protein
MKVVKLNRRFRQFKEAGHTVALRFEHGHTPDSIAIERACRDRLKENGWNRNHSWYTYYGDRPSRDAVRPYWITFRNEADLTLVLLSADLTKKP